MLSNNEIIVIFLSGFIGAILVLLTTFFALKYGSISGLITTIPTNTLVSLLGITINTNNYNQLQRSIYGTLILSYCAFIYLLLSKTIKINTKLCSMQSGIKCNTAWNKHF